MIYFKKLNKVIYTFVFAFMISLSFELYAQNEVDAVE